MSGVAGSSTRGGRLCTSLAGVLRGLLVCEGRVRGEPFEAEESLQEAQAFWLEYAAFRDFEMVVDAREGVQIGRATEASHFRVRDGVADSLDACHEECAGAHGAWLLGHVHCRVREPPVREVAGCLSEGEHLRVGGRVVRTFDDVMRCRDDFAVQFDDAPDRHFVLPPRVDRLVVGQAHEKLVVAYELRRESFLEGAGGRIGFGLGHGVGA